MGHITHSFKAKSIITNKCHGLLSNNALEKSESSFEKIIITNTVYLNDRIKSHSRNIKCK